MKNKRPIVLTLTFLGFILGSNFSLAFEAQVKNSLVCMMNDRFMGKEQIPVKVGEKTYYGCCEGCKVSLKENPSTRVSRDPYTGKEVDKADAFIVRKPDGSDEVLYFESRETYESFLKEHARVRDNSQK